MFIIGQIDFFLYLCGQITTCYDRTQGLCEMKFSQGKFSVGRDYAEKIQERIRRTMEYTENSKPVISVLVTTYGLDRNEYSSKFQKVVTMDDLFRF